MRVVRWMLAVLSTQLAGCWSCNLMYSPSTVTFTFAERAWAPGLWEIEVNGYNQGALCVVTLPWVEGDVVSCTASAALTFDEQGGIATFSAYEFAPESFGLMVLQDGATVHDEHIEPVYDVSEPNGKNCGERYVAAFDIDFP